MQPDRRKPQQFWTVEERATAMQLAKKGATAAAIGAAIGRTRNSVIGWLHRAGLKLKGAPPPKTPAPILTRPVERRAKPKPPAQPRYAAGYAYMTGANPMPPAPLPKREPLPPLGNLLTATANQCRWIDTAPAICGRDTKAGASYCPHHHSIVYHKKGAAVTITDEDKRKEIIEHIKTAYAHPDHAWEQRFLILQAQRAGPKELTIMHQIARSKKKMIHHDDQLALAHIALLYAAIAALLILLLGGCAVVVKQGTAPPVDPLTRKHYPTLEGKT